MSTVQSSPFISMVSTPVSVSIFIFSPASPASRRNFAAQRMPLPHISGSEPSLLKMRIRASAQSEATIQISPSAPTPKWRSQTARDSASGSGSSGN